MENPKIEPRTRARLFDLFCSDPEIRELVIRGTDFNPPAVEPVYEPDKSYVSQDITTAQLKARQIARAIAPDVDDVTLVDFLDLFFEARMEITKDMGR